MHVSPPRSSNTKPQNWIIIFSLKRFSKKICKSNKNRMNHLSYESYLIIISRQALAIRIYAFLLDGMNMCYKKKPILNNGIILQKTDNFITIISSSSMNFVDFIAHCQTRFGQTAYICGSSKQLGQWVPQNGVRLYTDISIYPRWQSYTRVSLQSTKSIEFKICFVHSSGAVRWEGLQQNRCMIMNSDCKVEITEDSDDIHITRCRFSRPAGQRRMWQILQQLESDSQQQDTSPFHYTIIEYKYKKNLKMHLNQDFDLERQARSRREVLMA